MLDKAYDHTKTEEQIYQKWVESGYFNPDKLPGERKEPYTIIMPPPNANAPMHLGHALFVTIEDILIRYKRMQGFKTLWQPGTDHAGFETQVVFEKKLDKEGRSRFHMTREEFYKETWDFVQSNKHITENSLKRLGASCDWSRNIFTLDPEIVKVVNQTFNQMFKDGLIYRSGRICNWCVKHQTSLADLETKYEERVDKFYYIKYGPFTIGTARPETKFGDKYLVVNPNDKRYEQYIDGQQIQLEWINGPITATVIKDEAADMEFGTGAMTITPWHDAVDFEIAQRRNLDMEQIIDNRGKLLPIAGEFAGMKITEAREKIVEKLQAKGLVEKIDENYKHNVQTCYKCNNIVEPQIIPQWYIAMTKPLKDGRPSLRDMAIQALDKKDIEIVTERFEKIYRNWMENLRDWPISRQIWWGIPIPAWYDKDGKTYLAKNIEITFARHGQSEYNAKELYEGWTDSSLTENGKLQAKVLAKKLANEKFDYIFSSELKRAYQTAEIVAHELQSQVTKLQELNEVKGGKFEGQPFDSQKPHHTPLLIRTIEAKEGETLEELESRAKIVIQKLSELSDGSKILIIGHNSFLAVLVAVLENKKPTDFIEFRKHWHLDNSGTLKKLVTINPQEPNLTQDPDTFDTWFSSGQWPFATLMANDAKLPPTPSLEKRGGKTASDFETFFPTQVMETGWDILFFWVARMVMLSYYKTGKPPFQKVYLHGLVRDKDRQKMSKSKGNVVDPLAVIETYGTDALRFALIFSSAAGNDIPLAEDKIKGMKHFANKLWNIARFILSNEEISNLNPPTGIQISNPEAITDADKDVLVKLDALIKSSTTHLENFRLHEAAQEIYHFTWHEFADVYIEESKKQLSTESTKQNTAAILLYCLSVILKLLHPFMPFVTEEIWSKLNQKDLLIVAEWPK